MALSFCLVSITCCYALHDESQPASRCCCSFSSISIFSLCNLIYWYRHGNPFDGELSLHETYGQCVCVSLFRLTNVTLLTVYSQRISTIALATPLRRHSPAKSATVSACTMAKIFLFSTHKRYHHINAKKNWCLHWPNYLCLYHLRVYPLACVCAFNVEKCCKENERQKWNEVHKVLASLLIIGLIKVKVRTKQCFPERHSYNIRNATLDWCWTLEIEFDSIDGSIKEALKCSTRFLILMDSWNAAA